jgi:hypothetical protein
MDLSNLHQRSSQSSIKMCDVVDCYQSATETIVVSAGKFGTINLDLCSKCAMTKFQKTAKVIGKYERQIEAII